QLGDDGRRASAPALGAVRLRRGAGRFRDRTRRRSRRPLQRRSARLRFVDPDPRAWANSRPATTNTNNRRSTQMKRFSPRMFALGLALGAIGAAALIAATAYAAPRNAARRQASTAPDQVIQ